MFSFFDRMLSTLQLRGYFCRGLILWRPGSKSGSPKTSSVMIKFSRTAALSSFVASTSTSVAPSKIYRCFALQDGSDMCYGLRSGTHGCGWESWLSSLSGEDEAMDAPRLMDQILSQVKELEISLSAIQSFLDGASSVPRGRISLIRVSCDIDRCCINLLGA